MPQPRRVLAAAVATALLGLCYGSAWNWRPELEGDSAGYMAVAADLEDGSLDALHDRPPGYPLLLAILDASETPNSALLGVQLILHALALLAVLYLLDGLGVGPVALAAVALLGALPPFVEHASFVLSETLVQTLVVAAVVGFLRFVLVGSRTWLATATFALAIVGLVHPANQLLWVAVSTSVLALCALLGLRTRMRRRALQGTAIIAICATLALGVSISFNGARFGFYGTSPMLGRTLSHKTVRVLELLPEEYAPVREILIRHRDRALLDPQTGHLGLAYIFRAMPEIEERTGLRGPELSSYLVEMNLALIRRAPMDYVDEVLRSVIWYWAPGVTDRSSFGLGTIKAAFNAVRASVLGAFVIAVVALTGPTLLLVEAVWSRRRSRIEPQLELQRILLVLGTIGGTLAYSTFVNTTLTAAVYRLRIPFDLLIVAFVAAAPSAWSMLREELRDGHSAECRPDRAPPRRSQGDPD